MRILRTWLLPAGLAAAQLALWPGLPLLTGDHLDPVQVSAGLGATALAAAALGWRRVAPVAVVCALVVASTLGQLATPTDALLVVSVADIIALYSVAVHRPARVTLVTTAAAVIWQALLAVPLYGLGRGYVGGLLLTTLCYLVVAGLGRSRRHWHAARAEAAARLARAETDRRQAADAERRRLARELHDVSAHHLTSIVVTATAAERLATRRPELTAEALTFARRTGRETLAALHRLVAVMQTAEQDGPQPLEVRLAELAGGFRQLGQRVTVRVEPVDVAAPVADAVYGIVREALTNTLRHAPAATVHVGVGLRGDALEVLVDDAGAAGAAPVTGLGSGRGLAGMRERAAAVGGTFSAGPRAPAGWRVHAVLPLVAGASRPAPGGGWRRRLRGERAVDTVVALAVVVFPIAGGLAAEDAGSAAILRPATGALLILIMMAHGLPLLWRRRRPWAVLAAVLATGWLWPLVLVLVPVAEELKFVLVVGGVAEFAAVYAVAAYGGRIWVTALSVPAAAVSLAAAIAGTAAADGSLAGEPVQAPMFLIVTAVTAFLLGVALSSVWGWGFAVRTQRAHTLRQEGNALAVSAAHAVHAVRVERARIAGGLRDAVQHRAALVVDAAERGDLDAVVAGARAALAAMRALLADLSAGEPARPRDPQPTAAGIATLCAAHRAAGRVVDLDAPPAPLPLPADVDVSAYRLVEVALAAGDTGPATVRLRYGADDLRVTVTGVPGATTGPAVAGLRARAGALGGRISVEPCGTIDVHLPVRPAAARAVAARPVPTEEVTPSPSV
jgi:signal transduction histidine kinase